ncbi:MAG TPA: lamin tail domain-containing protein [Chryseolinea sp.]
MKNILQKCRFSNLKSITAKLFLMVAAVTSCQQMFAQVVDDFSDGEFASNPTWVGSTSKFVVDSGRLKLNASPATDVAFLATDCRSINDATWEFLVRLDFNPSTSNFARLYLVSDKADLSSSLNGYFIQLGNTSDDVSLYKQSGSIITRIIDGVDGKLDNPTTVMRMKVTRDRDGTWEIYSDLGATGTYEIEGTTQDNEHLFSAYVGVLCSYSPTRSDKFYFDDFSVKAEGVSDVTPPEVSKVETLSANRLKVTFSEDIETSTASNPNNYSIDGFGFPDNVTLTDNSSVVLTFTANFAEEGLYVIRISGISDKYGNLIQNTQKTFSLLRLTPVQFKDMIFTEILADPSPKMSLPEVEFVEIFNRSENSINLDGWTLSDGTSTLVIAGLVLSPAEFLILSSNPLLFSIDVNSYGSADFPSLNNSDDLLILKDGAGKTIDSLHYSIDWYGSSRKKEGGWSLELIDPENVCAEGENWVVAEHPAGGTPGAQNSVLASNPDLTGPALRSAIPVSPYIIQVTFNEKLQPEVPLPENFVVDPPIMVKSVSFSVNSPVGLLIELATELSKGTSYSLTVNSIADCAGNEISESSNRTIFGLPENPLPSDILINEILFDPRPAGVDFVEIVNASGKFFNLKNWSIGNFENDTIANARIISARDVLLSPGAYMVFTEDLEILKSDYPSANEQAIIEIDDMPALNDDAGSIVITASNGLIMDSFHYAKSFHSIFIKDPEGVSLERIAFGISTHNVQNWKSSSTTSGYATPGYLNSNSRGDLDYNDEPVQIEPEVFIPVTGQPDFVWIHYEFDRGGYVANVEVLDAQGHPIRQLANNEILGTQGTLRWDGDRDDGGKVRVGYYMVKFEVFDDSGDVRTFLNRVAVATRF